MVRTDAAFVSPGSHTRHAAIYGAGRLASNEEGMHQPCQPPAEVNAVIRYSLRHLDSRRRAPGTRWLVASDQAEAPPFSEREEIPGRCRLAKGTGPYRATVLQTLGSIW